MNKVIGIGFHKTGTTTLEKCLVDLGFRPQAAWGNSHHLNKYWFEGDYEPMLKFAERFKSLSDDPWNFGDFYRHLDARFPGSKFILTVRDSEKWFDSLRRWCTPKGSKKTSLLWLPDAVQFHKAIFGITENSFESYKDHYIKVYEARNESIKEYFKDRPTDLLIIDWTKNGWKPLCDFLNRPIPNKPIPHLNKGKNV